MVLKRKDYLQVLNEQLLGISHGDVNSIQIECELQELS